MCCEILVSNVLETVIRLAAYILVYETVIAKAQ